MNTKEAVQKVLDDNNFSKYELAQRLTCAPVSIDQWLRGTKMSIGYRNIFLDKFGVEINDD